MNKFHIPALSVAFLTTFLVTVIIPVNVSLAQDMQNFSLDAGDADIPVKSIIILDEAPPQQNVTLLGSGVFNAPSPSLPGNQPVQVTPTITQGGGSSSSSTFTINLDNSPPVADNVEFTMLRNDSLSGMLSGSDPDSDDVIKFLTTSSPANGMLDMNSVTGQFFYYPNYNFVGSDSFLFVTDDNQMVSPEATANITVNQMVPMTRLEENLTSDFNPPYDPQNFEDLMGYLNATYEEASVTFRPFADDERVDEIEISREGDTQVIAPGGEATFSLSPGTYTYFYFTLRSQGIAIGRQYVYVHREGPPLASLRVEGFELSSPFDPKTRYYNVSNIPFETKSVSLFVESADPAIAFIRVTKGNESFSVTRASNNLAEPFVLPIPTFNGNYFTIDTLDENEYSLGGYSVGFYKDGKTVTAITENLADDLNQAFDPKTRYYSLNARFDEAEVSISVSTDDLGVTGFRVQRDGKGGDVDEGGITAPGEMLTVPLNFGWNNYLNILLYSGDEYVGSYYINIYREGPPLASLRVEGFELSSPFDPKTRYYDVSNIPFETENVSLFVESTDPAIAFIRVTKGNESFSVTRASNNLAEPFVLPIPTFNGNYFIIDTLDENENSLGRYDIYFYKKNKTLTGITENLADDLNQAFDPKTRDYSLNARFDEADVSISVSTDDLGVTGFRVQRDGKGGDKDQGDITAPGEMLTVPLNFGWNNYLTILLYSGDEYVGSYYINIYREGPPLASLRVDGFELSSPFDPKTRYYNVLNIPFETENVSLFVESTDPAIAFIRVTKGNESFSATRASNNLAEPFVLPVPDFSGNYFTIDTLDENENSLGRYDISFFKKDKTLTGITENLADDLNPAFDPKTRDYRLDARFEETEVSLGIRSDDPAITGFRVTNDGKGGNGEEVPLLEPGQLFTVPLNFDWNYFVIQLYAGDEFAGSYYLSIFRQGLTLSSLTEDVASDILSFNKGGTTDIGFQPDKREYYLLMLPDENAVTFTLKSGTFPETGRVHVVSSGVDQYISPNGTVILNVPKNEDSNDVSYSDVNFDLFLSEDPESYVGRYTVYIQKFAATLDGIAEDDPSGDLAPTFNHAIGEYTLRTALETEVIHFTPTAQNALIQSIRTYVYSEGIDENPAINVIAPGETFETHLKGVKTYVEMFLSGANNTHLGSYRVIVEKVPGSVSTLSSLAENTPADFSPAFAPGVTAYSLEVDNTVTQIQLSPAATSATAKVSINESNIPSGASPSFSLSVGGNAFRIFVTAQDKSVTVYTLTINRAEERTAGGGGGQVSTSSSNRPTSGSAPTPTVLGAKTQLYPDGTVMKVKGSSSKYYLMREGQKVLLTPLEFKKKYSKLPVVEVKKKILNEMPTLKKKKAAKPISLAKKKLP